MQHTTLVTWNVAGIQVDSAEDFLTEFHMITWCTIGFIQEFGPQESPQRIARDNWIAHIAPGLSKMSRSNCITIDRQLGEHIFGHYFCPIAQIVCLKIHSHVVALLNMHIPHSKHWMSIEESIDMIQDMVSEMHLALAGSL